jgi:hypothetical protein
MNTILQYGNDISIEVESQNALAIAAEIQRNRWRGKRATMFPALDAQWMEAMETGNAEAAAAAAQQKQLLRDVTLTPMPDSVEEIIAFWPGILN